MADIEIPPTPGQTSGQTESAAAAPVVRKGRPSKARGASKSADGGSARWTVRGVPTNVRAIARRAAGNRGLTLGDWLAEMIVQADKEGLSADKTNVPAPADLVDTLDSIKKRLTELETRPQKGVLGRLFGGQN